MPITYAIFNDREVVNDLPNTLFYIMLKQDILNKVDSKIDRFRNEVRANNKEVENKMLKIMYESPVIEQFKRKFEGEVSGILNRIVNEEGHHRIVNGHILAAEQKYAGVYSGFQSRFNQQQEQFRLQYNNDISELRDGLKNLRTLKQKHDKLQTSFNILATVSFIGFALCGFAYFN